MEMSRSGASLEHWHGESRGWPVEFAPAAGSEVVLVTTLGSSGIASRPGGLFRRHAKAIVGGMGLPGSCHLDCRPKIETTEPLCEAAWASEVDAFSDRRGT